MNTLIYTNEDLLKLEKTLPQLSEHVQAPVRAAIRHMRTELDARAKNGPCPLSATNSTPCARWKGHPGFCTASRRRGPATDTWSVTTGAGVEVARVAAPTAEAARAAAERIPAAQRASARSGGLYYRRLGAEEL